MSRRLIKAEDAGYPAEWHPGERFFASAVQQWPGKKGITLGWIIYHVVAAGVLIAAGVAFGRLISQ
jgi:hypothetical protein